MSEFKYIMILYTHPNTSDLPDFITDNAYIISVPPTKVFFFQYIYFFLVQYYDLRLEDSLTR